MGMLVVLCGTGMFVWDANPNFAEFVKGLGAPVKGHKMVEKEKRPANYGVNHWEYWWMCECGKEDYSTGFWYAYQLFLEHRSYQRFAAKKEEWKSKDKAARKGWL